MTVIPHSVRALIVGPLEANCYLLWDSDTHEAACIDPGGDVPKIVEIIEEEDLHLRYIINTHGHFDHIGGNGKLKDITGAGLLLHEEDLSTLEGASVQGCMFGIAVDPSPLPERVLHDGDIVMVGRLAIKVLHTPGHTRGSISLYLPDKEIVFTGDTLFAGGIGRTDLPGGSYSEIMDSIRRRLLVLDDNVRVLPGHGIETTIGTERTTNQFILVNLYGN